MNWDFLINMGMMILGVSFMLVALAQLMFGDFEEDEDDEDKYDGTTADEDYCEYSDFVKVPEEASIHEFKELTLKDMLSVKLDEIQDSITEQDDMEIAVIQVAGAAHAYEACIDEFENNEK